MPLYFFDVIIGGAIASPGEGVEFSSDEFARAYALGIASTFASGRSDGAPDRVSIRDAAGTPVGEVSPADLADEAEGSFGLPYGEPNQTAI